LAANPPKISEPRRADFRSPDRAPDRASSHAPDRTGREEPEEEYEPAPGRRKLAGRITLIALIVLAVITGSLAGLTLVYSADLPQTAHPPPPISTTARAASSAPLLWSGAFWSITTIFPRCCARR